jgi:hypothetical protein
MRVKGRVRAATAHATDESLVRRPALASDSLERRALARQGPPIAIESFG